MEQVHQDIEYLLYDENVIHVSKNILIRYLGLAIRLQQCWIQFLPSVMLIMEIILELNFLKDFSIFVCAVGVNV